MEKYKMKLEYLTPYLPYKFQTNEGELIGIRNWIGWGGVFKDTTGERNVPISAIRPHLRSLSDLTKEIEHNGERFVPNEKLAGGKEYQLTFYPNGRYFYKYREGTHCICSQGEMLDNLYEWHFDVFGLIEKGLAIDINNL